jgi:alpha-L-arabinofuranosidase
VTELQPYIQDALDLIEFANGPVNSVWGKVRAEMGHPAPFNLKYIAVGNEQWGEPYVKRLEPFIKAIREKYPKVKIVGSSGPSPDGDKFDFGWKEMTRLKADLVDEHYYREPDWFLNNANRYDKYNRKDPNVFAGEYACHLDGGRNNYMAAICEAAFMTGLERNADVVHMTAYAPLFAHAENWQWRPDLIWFDNLNVVKTPSYYVQQLYATHPGTNVLKTTCNEAPLAGKDSIYASSVIDKNKGEIILKVVNVSKLPKTVLFHIDGLKEGEHHAVHTIFFHKDIKAENTFEDQDQVVPVNQDIIVNSDKLRFEINPCSFHLVSIKP